MRWNFYKKKKLLFIENMFDLNPEFRSEWTTYTQVLREWFIFFLMEKENAHRHIYSSAHIEISKQWCIASWHTASVRYFNIVGGDCMRVCICCVRVFYACACVCTTGCMFCCVVNGMSTVNVWTLYKHKCKNNRTVSMHEPKRGRYNFHSSLDNFGRNILKRITIR